MPNSYSSSRPHVTLCSLDYFLPPMCLIRWIANTRLRMANPARHVPTVDILLILEVPLKKSSYEHIHRWPPWFKRIKHPNHGLSCYARSPFFDHCCSRYPRSCRQIILFLGTTLRELPLRTRTPQASWRPLFPQR